MSRTRPLPLLAVVLVISAASPAAADEAPPTDVPAKAGGEPTALQAAAGPLVADAKAEPEWRTDPNPGIRKVLGLPPRCADPFDGFSRPVTNLSFHHPFLWNEIRPVYVHHWFPETSALQGGHLDAYAIQIHAKLTERIGFTAWKDGYVDLDSGAFEDEEGFADLAFGFKVKVWEDAATPAILTVGLGYETTGIGDEEVLEGEGDGFFDAFASCARGFEGWNFIGTAGCYIPRTRQMDVQTFHWHLHADVPLSPAFAVLAEVNGFHYLDDGERNAGFGPDVPLGFEGFDYTTLGAGGVDGNDVVSGALGFRWRLSDDVSVGAAWEVALTDREDVIDKRLTVDLVLRF